MVKLWELNGHNNDGQAVRQYHYIIHSKKPNMLIVTESLLAEMFYNIIRLDIAADCSVKNNTPDNPGIQKPHVIYESDD